MEWEECMQTAQNGRIDSGQIKELRGKWRAKADALIPVLQHRQVVPESLAELVGDPEAWQGMRAVPVEEASKLSLLEWRKGESLILDFGEHHVGYFTLSMRIAGDYCDSPVSLRLLAAELPFELAYRAENFKGSLSQAWIQEEYIKIDVLPGTVRLPRRYACRYLRIDVIATPGTLVFDRIEFDTVSAANYLPEPPLHLSAFEKEIYIVGCRTLRDCMQTCFEDGPKRDRRLWLGDLYLEAKVNAVTYRDFHLVERSIYLLAANIDEHGMLPACAFEDSGIRTTCFIPDYSLLFSALLLEHCRACGKREIAEEFYPLAVHQAELFQRFLQDGCILKKDPGYWFFVDHCAELEKDTAELCIYLFALRSLAELAHLLGVPEDGERFRREHQYWRKIVRSHTMDPVNGVIVSGASRQISEASQIWAVLSGVFDAAEGKRALAKMKELPGVIRSRNPYVQHYLLEAYWLCGEEEKACGLIHDYWGEMIRLGADTFWEVFDSSDRSPVLYGDACLTSACHAWSCTPCLFLHRKSARKTFDVHEEDIALASGVLQ